MHHLFAAALLLLPLCSSAQTLRGTVIDVATQLPVEFATVSLLQAADSSLLLGAVAGAGGSWELRQAPNGAEVIVRASFLGYKPTESDRFTVAGALPPLQLG
ncbi:MAG: carboxypeptidase regulatory-like domain-containing protein, partial [Bacteroidota bacterium]